MRLRHFPGSDAGVTTTATIALLHQLADDFNEPFLRLGVSRSALRYLAPTRRCYVIGRLLRRGQVKP